jgi:hypothetical protein
MVDVECKTKVEDMCKTIELKSLKASVKHKTTRLKSHGAIETKTTCVRPSS